jgi:hypothetical protein
LWIWTPKADWTCATVPCTFTYRLFSATDSGVDLTLREPLVVVRIALLGLLLHQLVELLLVVQLQRNPGVLPLAWAWAGEATRKAAASTKRAAARARRTFVIILPYARARLLGEQC